MPLYCRLCDITQPKLNMQNQIIKVFKNNFATEFYNLLILVTSHHFPQNKLQSTLVISNFTGPDKNVRVISSSRQPNCDVIGTCMTTVRLCSPKRGWKAHVYGNLNNICVIQFALLLFVLGDAIVLLE